MVSEELEFYDGDKKNVVIPEGIELIAGDELKLVGFKEFAENRKIICFPQKDCKYVESITMPDSVLYIGPKAFESCADLKKIHFSRNLKLIGFNAFFEVEDIYFDDSIFKFDKIETKHAFLNIRRLHCSDCDVDFTSKDYKIKELKFNGTVSEWNGKNDDSWIAKTSAKIICSDGVITKCSEA